jgi:hypothetical protein
VCAPPAAIAKAVPPVPSTDQVVQLLGIGLHRLRALHDRRFLTPSMSRGQRGRGHQRLFSRCDLVAIRSAQELTRLGVVGTRLRRFCREIRRLERSGMQRMLLVVTHAGPAIHVPRARDLSRLVRRVDGPYGHVVLDLHRMSRDVRRLIRARPAATSRHLARGG